MADFVSMAPSLIILVTAFALLMFEVFSEGKDRSWAARVAVFGLGLSLYILASEMGDTKSIELFSGALLLDPFARHASIVFVIAGIVACLISPTYMRNANCESAEYYALLLLSIIGMMVMTMAADLMTLFLGLEVMSIAVYVLTGLRTRNKRSGEAAMKYFLMGAFATAFLLFGISMIYGATGSVHFHDMKRAMVAGSNGVLNLGLVLLVLGFSFKVAAVPFHSWAPDVYEGAPTPVTGFMAVAVKAAAFFGLLRIVVVGMGEAAAASHFIIPLFSGIAIATILVGNVLALVQKSVKRMLAYSSVSHAGYAMIGMAAVAQGEQSAASAVLFYLAAYTFMTLGAFSVLTYLERKEGHADSERFGAYAGIGFKYPGLSLAMTLFMIALAGMPLTGGFVGKLYLFSAAIKADLTYLVGFGILGSVVSVYYYLRVVVAFYMRDVADPGPVAEGQPGATIHYGLILTTIGVLFLGLLPGSWLEFTQTVIQALYSS
ncbi:MAG: NADH-quinone oxidoreductase subunit N [Myxococcota bacterium]|nr:NADH-quinone oxidoreductase subunit N [Myxococcota bacterium]